jgi:proteic killer suppression protein
MRGVNIVCVIISYLDKDTENLAKSRRVKKFQSFERVALRKLTQFDIVANLEDLRIPPGNHLEALSGNRAGQYSIRINNQYRICFVWTENGPQNVEIVDYH